MRLLPLFLILLVTVGCGPSHEVRLGQRVFAGCDRLGVDDKATLKAGVFICKGEREDVFRGNGIACGDCHIPGDNFGMNPDRALPPDHILFTAALLDNDPALVQDHGLIRVITVGTLGPVNQDRQVPKLVHLRDLCDKHTGNCDGLGLLGDRVENLNVFTPPPEYSRPLPVLW